MYNSNKSIKNILKLKIVYDKELIKNQSLNLNNYLNDINLKNLKLSNKKERTLLEELVELIILIILNENLEENYFLMIIEVNKTSEIIKITNKKKIR